MSHVAPQTQDRPAAAPSALAEVYRAHFSYVWHAARRVGIASADLEDVVQEVFVVVGRKLPEFDVTRPLKPWLFGILYRVALDWRRRGFRTREVPVDELVETDPRDGPEQQVERGQQRALVAKALDALDWDKRVVLVMHEFQELGVPEIAAVLGIPVNTAYSRLRLARRDFSDAVRAASGGGGHVQQRA
ncbi:MAG: sigma-70 family RNA polymerase sigma factor [Myxococcota bacterium]